MTLPTIRGASTRAATAGKACVVRVPSSFSFFAAENEDQRGKPALASTLYLRALAVYDATGDARNADVLRQRLVARPAP